VRFTRNANQRDLSDVKQVEFCEGRDALGTPMGIDTAHRTK